MSESSRAARDRLRIGREGEQRVVQFLLARGLVILQQNLRIGRDEIDILARDGTCLVIVEVRTSTRSSTHPFETIRAAKAHRLRRAASALMQVHNAECVRIDVIAVTNDQIERLENAIDFSET